MPKLDLSKPQRQSPIGVGVLFFKKLRVAINIFISIIVVQFGFQSNLSSLSFMIIVAIVLLIVFLIAFLHFRKFTFYVEEDSFIIEKGLVRRDKVAVPFDRIQSVHINQNLIQRILGVVGLKVDTAGSAIKELEISALPKSYARSLQEYLTEQRDAVLKEDLDSEPVEVNIPISGDLKAKKSPLIKLDIKDILRIGITENHLKRGLILFAIINGYIWQYEEFLLAPFEELVTEYEDYVMGEWLFLLPIALAAFLVVAVLLSLIQAILRYFDLRFFVDEKGVQLLAGLVKKAEYQIPVNKIQFIKWSSNPLRKIFGLKTISVKQAGSNQANDKQSMVVPGSSQEQLDVVLDEFYPERHDSTFVSFQSHHFFKIQLLILFGILPALLLSLLFFYDPWFLLSPFLWLLIAIPLAMKFAVSWKIECNKDLIKFKRGWIFPKVVIIKYYKIQNLKINQNIFQRKRNTVHLDFFTAGGNLRMWQLDEKVAKELYDYILYKVESSEASWM
tara:strand:- start:8 stop:1516 length:1509 start_codon:yes stop_codon:yes gene_type:complete